jgi:secreted trypsin-like serine protease
MIFLKYFSVMILLSAVNSDNEDICTTKSFEPTSENVKSSNDIKIQEFPFLASYGHYEKIKNKWKHVCTASVLTKRTLLTAAHCFKKNAPEDNSVILGQKNLNSETGSDSVQEISISHGISHPEYDNVSAYFDIAVIHTDEDIKFANGVKPACLSNETFKTTDFLQNENRETYLAGWGIKSETEIYAPSILSSSSLNLFTEESCNSKYDIFGSSAVAQQREKFLPNLFNSKVICAGSTVSNFDNFIMFTKLAASHLVLNTFSPQKFSPSEQTVPKHLVPMDKWSPRQLVPKIC